MDRFNLINQYVGTMMDIDVSAIGPGERVVTETARRLRCEQSFGYVHALYGICFRDGRVAFSVTPGARADVVALLARKRPDFHSEFDRDWLNDLAACVNRVRARSGLAPSKEAREGKLFACDAARVRRYEAGDLRRLRGESIPPFEGLMLPTHCFPDGIVYGIVDDGRVVSVAYAHRSGRMQDQVADLAVETAAPYRRRGYAKTVVSAVTLHMTPSGGQAIYTCGASNESSMATASSVGYELYGRTITIAAPRPEGE